MNSFRMHPPHTQAFQPNENRLTPGSGSGMLSKDHEPYEPADRLRYADIVLDDDRPLRVFRTG